MKLSSESDVGATARGIEVICSIDADRRGDYRVKDASSQSHGMWESVQQVLLTDDQSSSNRISDAGLPARPRRAVIDTASPRRWREACIMSQGESTSYRTHVHVDSVCKFTSGCTPGSSFPIPGTDQLAPRAAAAAPPSTTVLLRPQIPIQN